MGESNFTIGFLVNPIAGMGGSVGLKGTDGDLYLESIKRGSKPVAPVRAFRFLKKLSERVGELSLIVPPKQMGWNYAKDFFKSVKVLTLDIGSETTKADTIRSCELMVNEGVDLVVFVGGDGTAKDVYDVVGSSIPILGVPSGVKMYSGVFAMSPEAAAEIVSAYINNATSMELGEVADVDERSLKDDVIKVRVYGIAKVPQAKELLTPSKDFRSSDADKDEVAEYVVEHVMKSNTLYLLGPGTTIKAIADRLGVPKTLLGVDAVFNGNLVGKDLSERRILELLKDYRDVKILLTPIGRQGFILGRGNQQISPEVIRIVGKHSLIIVATRNKLLELKYLRVDTGDPEIDKELEGYIRVIVGSNEEMVIRVLSFT
ncbi:MAG: ATP-NAD kinase family protein [Sulfolobales archaeon]|nr:ATP-NAD kinase family protein [Sulfolobales archaeon]